MNQIIVDNEELGLWAEYIDTGSERAREKLVVMYVPLVKWVVSRQLSHLPDHLSKDYLVSSGILGLIHAVEKFNPELKVQFKTFAVPRIKGAILDELRSYDVIPRSIRLKMKEVKQAVLHLEAQLKRTPNEKEIAEDIGLSLDEYRELLRKMSPVRFLSLSQRLNSDADWELPADDQPESEARYEDMKEELVEAMQRLEKNERLLIALYYYEKLTMKEIGEVLGVSESRVSQIHTQAVVKLRCAIDRV